MNRLRLFLLLPLLAVPLLAHDTWLIPSTLRIAPGSSVEVRLATSEAFPTSEAAASPDRISRFFLRQTSGAQPVTGYRVDGTFLLARVTPSEPGHAIVIAETRPRAFVLEPKVFNEYLQDEQLASILRARAGRNQSASPGRERYQKIAKTILCVGPATDSLHSQPNDLWLEIIPLRDPCSLRVGDSLPVRVLFRGRPLARAHVAAGYPGVTGHKYPLWVLTDATGRASLTLDRPGFWFARVLHMVPAAGDPEADWRSAFSTLTFEVAPAESTAADADLGLRSLLRMQQDAWNRGDIEGFMDGYSKSDATAFVGSSGVSRGWQALLDRYRRNYPDRAAMGQLQFSDLEITPLGPDAALILGRWQLIREKDPPGGVFTLVARKFPEGWRIIHDHTSSVAPREDDQWNELIVKEAGIRILMPCKATKEEHKQDSRIILSEYSLARDGVTYLVGWTELSREITDSEVAQKALDAGHNHAVQQPGTIVISESTAKFSGYPGRDLVVERGERQFHIRIYAIGSRAFQLIVGAPKSKDITEQSRQFFTSFQLTQTPEQ